MMRALALACALLTAAASAAAQTFVYGLESGRQPVMSSVGGIHAPTIHLINATTTKDLATIQIATQNDKGTALRLSSDARLLFATTVSHLAPTGAGKLWVIDAIRRTTMAVIPVGGGPSDLAVLPDSSRAYVVNTAGNSISVVDLNSLIVTATIPLPGAPARIAVSPAGNAVYVTQSGSASVSKISTTTNSVDATIGVGPTPRAVDISPDGTRMFVLNTGNATISVIDAALDSVLRVIPAGSTSDAASIDLSAQSATRVFVTTTRPQFISGVELVNAADGSTVGSTSALQGLLARHPSGTPTFLVASGALMLVAPDASSTTTLATAANWNAAAVFTDPCGFESTVTPAAFGPAGGSGTLTIAAPAACAWAVDTSLADFFSVSGPLSGTGPATRTVSVSGGDTPKLGTIAIGSQVLTLERTIPRMNIDTPKGDGPVLRQPFTIAGWAIDQNLGVAPPIVIVRSRGIDSLHVWAYPASGAPPVFLGTASLGGYRPDVGVIYGMAFCGFNLTVSGLPNGTYTIVVFAHSEITNAFVIAQGVTVTVTVPSPPDASPLLVVDTPAASSTITGAFDVGGWAIDPAASGRSGVDAVHVWAYPVTGAAPMFVGAATKTERPDVSSFFNNPNYHDSGFLLRGATLPAGTYDLVVFAHSTVTNTFNNSKVVRITVQ